MALDWWTSNQPRPVDPSGFNRYGGGVTGGMVPGTQPYGSDALTMAPETVTGQPAPAGGAPDDFGGPQNGDYQGWFNKLIAGKPYNQQTLLEIEPILQKYGVQLTPPNAVGERTKINIPGQGWVRVGFGEGKPVWIPQGGAGGDGGQPFEGRAGGGGVFTPRMAGGIEPYQAPPFEAPSGLTEANDPGFRARMQMGTEAIETSAAARGGILSGGTLKALDRYAQDYASNEYGNVFGRALTTAGYNAGQGQQGYLNRYGQYSDWQGWAQRNKDRGQRAAESAYRPPTM